MVIMEIYKNLSLKDMEGEIWKDIKEYEGLYQVSNMGRVKSLNYRGCKGKERIMKQSFYYNGYLKISLKKNRKIKTIKVHRLVAIAFIPNVENKPEIDHKNTIKTDNRVENLRFVTHKENMNNELTRKHNSEAENNRYKGRKHSEETKEKMSEAKKGKSNSNYKGFICIFPNGEVTKEMTKKELEEMLGISRPIITNIVKSNKPYKTSHKKLKHLNGIRIYYYQDYLKLESGDKIA